MQLLLDQLQLAGPRSDEPALEDQFDTALRAYAPDEESTFISHLPIVSEDRGPVETPSFLPRVLAPAGASLVPSGATHTSENEPSTGSAAANGAFVGGMPTNPVSDALTSDALTSDSPLSDSPANGAPASEGAAPLPLATLVS